MTRRDFIGGCTALAASAALGKPRRSSIGGRRNCSNGNGLPYDTDIEYLESTGTEYFQTEIMADYTMTAVIDFAFLPSTTIVRFLGSRDGENPSFMFSCSNKAGHINDYGSGYNRNRIQYEPFKPMSYVGRWKFEYGNRYIKNLTTGNVQVSAAKVGPTSAGVPSRPLLLWALQDGASVLTGSIGRIYSATIIKSDTVVSDLWPVRFTNESGETEGALFDRATGKMHYNAGSGKFIVGPDKGI